MLDVLTVLTLILVVLTFLPLWHHPHWLVRGLDFPRFQIAVVAIASFIVQCFILDSQNMVSLILISVTAICVIWQLWWVLPYTRLWPKEVKSAKVGDKDKLLTILTSNVLAHNKNSQALIDLIDKYSPDILVTLESNHWWEEQLKQLENKMPYCIKCPLENLYGMHVYSSLPLTDTSIAFLVEDDVPSMHANLTLKSGDIVKVHFIHPAPPSPTENTESSERDAELAVLARSISETTLPVIVTGDLNDVAWSSTTRLFRKVSGLLDPRVGRGMFNTFHAGYPFLRWPLDHLFHSDHFTLKFVKRMPSIGSDHFPLLTQVLYSSNHQQDQSSLEKTKEDEARAKKLSNEEDVDKKDVPL
jgi:endonuclease/exonuclease/phosphatase (EEP) superfamily protein YafD